MSYIDVFNGDADGLCSLQQLRLDEPVESRLVTGVKRDIALLERVEARTGDEVTVLDVSLDKNRAGLERVLAAGARVRYFDHHYAGEVPGHPRLVAHIGQDADRGTSLIVDDYLEGRHRAWAVVGTFGDNFDARAREVARGLGLAETDLARLRELGTYLNYNGYGASVADLYYPPDELFRRLHPYVNPLELVASDAAFARLRDGYREDMARAEAVRPVRCDERIAVYVLPAEPWARRVGGVFANRLAREAPGRAHALLTRLDGGGYVVSVRSPLETREGADVLCREFPTGGGRKAAAGINHLPEEDYERFVARFAQVF